MKLLHIDSSITDDKSISRQLSAGITAAIQQANPNAETLTYDLDKNPVGHLSNAVLSGQDAQESAVGSKMLEEFKAAEVIVIGAPMYNFSISSQLKAWIDRIAVSGQTFRYTAQGPVGLMGGKRVIVASVRGGYYGEESGLASLDHQERYLTTVFNFMGITDITFIRAEGVNTGAENAAKAIATAQDAIAALSTKQAA